MSEDSIKFSSPGESLDSDENKELATENDLNKNVTKAFQASALEPEDKVLKQELPITVSEEVKNKKVQEVSRVTQTQPNNLTSIFEAIESAMPEETSLKDSAFPHPRNWLGPRFMALWGFPIIAINKTKSFISSSNPIRPYSKSEYSVEQSETIYTAASKGFSGNKPMRFFGARFLTIWVLPIAITGTVMEFLFVSPLTGSRPFG